MHCLMLLIILLVQILFDYPRQSNGYGFPFDRPQLDFYHRLQKVHQLLGEIKDIHIRGSIKEVENAKKATKKHYR